MEFMKRALCVAGVFAFFILAGIGAAEYGLAASRESNAA